jgi:hypothetical protein
LLQCTQARRPDLTFRSQDLASLNGCRCILRLERNQRMKLVALTHVDSDPVVAGAAAEIPRGVTVKCRRKNLKLNLG